MSYEGANINATRIDGGGVDDTEFSYLNGVTSAIQTQIDTKGAGSVTSVSLTMPTAIFDISGSPVTGSGTLAVTLDNQTANTIFAGPTSGGAATPTFRAMVAADLVNHASRHNAGGADAMAIDSAAGTGSLRTLGTASTAACAGNDARLLGLVDLYTRWAGMQGPLGSGTILLVSDTAYFVYLGRVATTFTPAYVKVFCGTVAAGTQTAEIGLFSSSSGPNAANQSLTKIEATGTITALSGTGVKQNTSAFTTSVPAGTHLWAGIRTAMSITQPTCNALNRDYARGTLLTTATAGALTNAGPWTGVVVAATASTAEAPVLWTSQDA